MFFAALFAMYFTIRSVSPELWETEPELLNIPFSTAQHHRPGAVLGHLPARRVRRGAGRRRPAAAAGSSSRSSWARSSSAARSTSTPTLVSDDGLTLSSDAYGSVFYLTTGFHGLHVTGGLIAFLLVLGRTYTARRFTHEPGDQRDRRVLLLALRRRRLDRPVRDHLPASSERARDPTEQAAGRPSARCRAAAATGSRRWSLLLLALGVDRRRLRRVRARPATRRPPPARPPQIVDEGRALFLRNCSSCHGLNAEGSSDGPTPGRRRARPSVDFQVGTGRMPAAQLGRPGRAASAVDVHRRARSRRWPPTSPRSAPARRSPPTRTLDYADADIAEGGEIFRTNCAMCHNFAGSGGALTRGKYAPVAEGHDAEAHLRGDAHRPAVDAGLRRQHA